MIRVHAQIEYNEDGKKDSPVHSDICPPNCDFEKISGEYRKFYHNCLDEWLDRSKGTGAFWIAEHGYEMEKLL